MLRYCYTLLSYLIQPLILFFMWRKSWKQPEYRARLAERYGFYGNATPPSAKGVVIHAASVGEVIAATPLIKAIQAKYPQLPLLHQQVQKGLKLHLAIPSRIFIYLMICRAR